MQQRSPWQDPPAFRGGGGGGGVPQLSMPGMTPVTKKLLIANFGIWFLTWLLVRFGGALGQGVYDFFALTPDRWRAWFPFVPVWEVVSYGFLHSVRDPMHILFNSLMLYFFGTMLEGIVGSRRFLATYLAAMVLGGLAQALVGVATGSVAATVGASGAVLGVLVACAVLEPNQQVIFIIVFVRLWILAAILVGLDFFFLINGGGGNTAYLVHLVGAAYGFLTARRRWIWLDPVDVWERRSRQRAHERKQDENRTLDELLERIHREGIHSLSQRERDFLKRVSKRR